MMISLGYYFDQVSRERMVQRISERAGLITGSTPTDKPLFSGEQVWVDVAHPVYHDLTIAWRVGDRDIASAANQPYLNLTPDVLTANDQTVSVTVADMTDFVRDPAIRSSALTATRSWPVRYRPNVAVDGRVVPAITNATQTIRPIGGKDVVFIDHSHDGLVTTPKVEWTLDGRVDTASANRFSFNLAQRSLPSGTHTLTVTLPEAPGSSTDAAARRTWTIDNTPPTVAYILSPPVARVASVDGVEHAFMRDEFTMKLDPKDDQPGYLVAEFRVDGDGWHHYYGWPDAPQGTPFKFTPRGTNIKELIYGSLSSEGLAPQPWEAREPGWGTRTIEYRAIDAAGNYAPAKAFRVTVMPSPQCTVTVTGTAANVNASTGVTCLNGATISGPVTVAAGATLVATNSTITGALTATNAATIELVNTSLGGALTLTGTTERITIFGATVSAEASINNSTAATAPLITGSTLRGGLACTGNAVAPTSGGTQNTVTRGATGQCGGL